jgi:anaerobic magnesium-protoporphyrin IX monomethyl ester cyclase
MSLLALGAVLEGHYRYTLIDGNLNPDPLGQIRAIIRKGCRVIAVTVMPGTQLEIAFLHSTKLKGEFPELTIVWGGYFPTLHTAACLRSPAIDYVIRGHGELVFLELLTCMELGQNPCALPGLAYRNHAGRTIENPMALIPDPEDLPSYPYHRVNMEEYVRPTFLGSRTLPHHSSYGCPFACNFCGVVNMVQGKWQPQSAARVAGIAAKYAAQWGVNAIEFHDNNFFANEARVAEFSERVKPLGLSWWGEGRIDTLLKYSEETWKSMRVSGLKSIFMGAESASADTLMAFNKGGTLHPDQTLEMAALMRRHGIIPEFSFMTGNPPEPEREAEATLKLIRRVKGINPASEIVIYLYAPVPSHEETAANRDGFSFPDTLEEWTRPEWLSFSSRRNSLSPWLSPGRMRQVRNFERVLNAYYPTTTDLRLTAPKRALLRIASAWRYHTRVYGWPVELRILQRLFHYQRPETSGF